MPKKNTDIDQGRNVADSAVMDFAFGDPESVVKTNWLDYLGVFATQSGEWYEPPFLLSGLAKMRNVNAHHGSCLLFRRNMLASAYVSKPALNVVEFRNLAYDYLTFGNCYLQVRRNLFGRPVGLRHVPALNMRVKTGGGFRLLQQNDQFIDFEADEILQCYEYDAMQQYYGIPDWLGGLQSSLLNEDATLFRRRYFVNGAHLGYVFYTSDPNLDPKTQEALKEKIRQGKGVGNFRSLYMHIPNGKEKAVQILPIGDMSQKDEFQNIKNISADDVLVAHRVPGALAGVRPANLAGDTNVKEKRLVYLKTETAALTQPFLGLNDLLPRELQFEFVLPTDDDDGEGGA